jgi:hypothetical protein
LYGNTVKLDNPHSFVISHTVRIAVVFGLTNVAFGPI